jgi:hypothetical protein
VTAPGHSSQRWQTIIQIERFGFRATLRKSSIETLGTYEKVSLAQYCALRETGAPKATPTMCILTIKLDEMLNPFRAKAQIVVLGNHEDFIWSKSENYAPVLCPDTVQLILSRPLNNAIHLSKVIVNMHSIRAFYLPMRSQLSRPIGDPEATKDEYWLLNNCIASITVHATGTWRSTWF